MDTIIKSNIETQLKVTSESGLFYATFNKDVTFNEINDLLCYYTTNVEFCENDYSKHSDRNDFILRQLLLKGCTSCYAIINSTTREYLIGKKTV